MKRTFLLAALVIGTLLTSTTIPEDWGFSPAVYSGVVVFYCVAIILALLEIRNAI